MASNGDADDSATYLSVALRERLQLGTRVRPPERRDLEGALAFVDISGFSKLAAELTSAHGHSEGAEMLQAYVNQYLQHLIANVLDAQGDIIKFAGDAFISCMVVVAAAAAAAAVIGVAAVVRNSVSDSSRCSVYARCLPSALATFLDQSIVV